MNSDDQRKQAVREVFDRIANREDWERLYAGTPNRLTYNFISRQRAVEEMLAPIRLGRVLELGCGTGDLSPFLIERATGYTGVDISTAMIERARANYGRQIGTGRARFEAGDCERLQFGDASFDTVVAVALIEYLPDPSKALDEMRRVLKPGGHCLITVPHRRCLNRAARALFAPVRWLLFPLYVRLTGRRLAEMKDVKHYAYTREELEAMMAARGFQRSDCRFSNFYFLMHPLDHVAPWLYMKLSEWADRSGRGERFRLLAANYNALFRKQ
jgi:ubiquinone/menaquinone biosynthesis C-methylase UbiE